MENLENKNISNAWAYASVGCMLYGVLNALTIPLDFMPANDLASLGFIFGVVDAVLLKQAKVTNAPNAGWMLIAPVYYYKRQKILNQPMTLFYTVLVCLTATLVILFVRAVFSIIYQSQI